MIIDHLSLPSSDLARSQAFFIRALAPLGIGVLKAFPETIGMGREGADFQRGFAFIARAKRASSIRSAISRK